jgi:hypothetical protein
MPRLSQPKAFPAPVLVNELDAGSLQSAAHCVDGCKRDLSSFFLENDDRRDPKVGRVPKQRLRDLQNPTGRATMGGGHFINNFC